MAVMTSLKIADVRDRGFKVDDIYLRTMENATGIGAWFTEQGFRWTEVRIGRAWWVVFDTPAQAVAFKMCWL